MYIFILCKCAQTQATTQIWLIIIRTWVSLELFGSQHLMISYMYGHLDLEFY